MGLSFAPALAQHLTEYVLKLVHNQLPEDCDVFSAVWIDNFVFASDDEQHLDEFDAVLRSVCAELGLLLKRTEHEDDQGCITILGLTFFTESMRLSARLRQHLADAHAAVTLSHRTPSARAVMTWFGGAMFACFAVCRMPLCLVPTVMALARRTATAALADGWGTKIALLPEELAAVDALTDTSLQCTRTASQALWYRDLLGSSPTSHLWTDASTEGVGAVCIQDMQVQWALREDWDIPARKIFLGEMVAGLTAAAVAQTQGVTRFMWVTDNSAAARAVIRGHSASAAGDAVLRQWIVANPPQHVALVRSEENLADALSRRSDRVPDVGPTYCAPQAIPIRWTFGG